MNSRKSIEYSRIPIQSDSVHQSKATLQFFCDWSVTAAVSIATGLCTCMNPTNTLTGRYDAGLWIASVELGRRNIFCLHNKWLVPFHFPSASRCRQCGLPLQYSPRLNHYRSNDIVPFPARWLAPQTQGWLFWNPSWRSTRTSPLKGCCFTMVSFSANAVSG